jgi:hypothetical protein
LQPVDSKAGPSAGLLHVMPPVPELLAQIAGKAVIRGAAPKEIMRALAGFPASISGVEFTGALSSLPDRELIGDRELIIYLDDERELISQFHRLPKTGVCVRLNPVGDPIRLIKAAASLGLTLDLLPGWGGLNQGQVMQALELYLHEKSLAAALEPFHSILARLLSGQEIDLWTMAGIDPDRLVYMDEQGRVALSRFDLEAGRFMGGLQEGPLAWRRSQAYGECQTYRLKLPKRQPDCLRCRFYAWCRGWARFGEHAEGLQACHSCLAAFEGLLKAHGELSRLQRMLADKGLLPGQAQSGTGPKTMEPAGAAKLGEESTGD